MFKKVFLAVLAIVGSISIANAQEVFHKGTTAINAGIGLGSYYNSLSIPPSPLALTTVSRTTSSTATTGLSL